MSNLNLPIKLVSPPTKLLKLCHPPQFPLTQPPQRPKAWHPPRAPLTPPRLRPKEWRPRQAPLTPPRQQPQMFLPYQKPLPLVPKKAAKAAHPNGRTFQQAFSKNLLATKVSLSLIKVKNTPCSSQISTLNRLLQE
jgi:hypothetical protein